MANDSINSEVTESSVESQNIISYERMITIINLMFVKKQGATFLGNADNIKAFPLLSEEEKVFVDKVYEKIKELGISEDVTKITNMQQLKDELYGMCKIPSNVIENVKQKIADKKRETMKKIAKDKNQWAKQDEESGKKYARTVSMESVIASSNIGTIERQYKKALYQPETLCGRATEVPEKPYVKLERYAEDRIDSISPKTSYQFADRTYIIRKVGNLLYMPTPNLKDSLSAYEVTVSKDDISQTVRVFGEISFDKMSNPYYNAAVFLQLLGVSNLTDRELHGYIGSLEQVRDQNGELKDQYRMVHSPEEYTAVTIWEQIEKESKGKNEKNQDKLLKSSGKVAGGDER